MKIEPKSSPEITKPANATPIVQQGLGNQRSPQASSTRDKAIAMLMGQSAQNQSQATPVANPNSVSPEESVMVQQAETESVETPPEGQEYKSETSEEAAPQETAPAEPKEETKGDDSDETLSQQYAVLARKEKALRAKAQAQSTAIQQREAQIAQREQAMKAKEAEYSSKFISIDKLQDPVVALTILEQHGLTYDKLTEAAAIRPNRDPYAQQQIEALTAKIAALEGKTAEVDKRDEERSAQSYQAAVKQIRTEATNLVTRDPAFETIKETGSINDVVDLIERTFKEDGVLLSVEEAAQAVEDHLVEELIKATKIKKIQQKLNPSSPTQGTKPATPAQPKAGDQSPQKSQPMKTLTNSQSTPRPASVRERAILAFEGKLKS